jgi:hypothetical protein
MRASNSAWSEGESGGGPGRENDDREEEEEEDARVARWIEGKNRDGRATGRTRDLVMVLNRGMLVLMVIQRRDKFEEV